MKRGELKIVYIGHTPLVSRAKAVRPLSQRLQMRKARELAARRAIGRSGHFKREAGRSPTEPMPVPKDRRTDGVKAVSRRRRWRASRQP